VWLRKPAPGPVVVADSSPVQVRVGTGRNELSLPRGQRAYHIEAGPLVVRTAGGRLIIAASEERIDVQVIEGELTLEGDGTTRKLTAGESFTWTRPEPPREPEPQPQPEKPKPAAAAPSWRALAAKNKFREAYDALSREGVAPPAKAQVTAGDLITRADVARLSGHAAEAVPLLERVLDEFPEDRRAALAAFTKGRIHADSLSEPRAAALAFKRALALGLPDSLVEDAHARAVEAWIAAGDRDAARAAAQAYETQFQSGKHRDRIQRWLEPR
jgi:transmembrane sensor